VSKLIKKYFASHVPNQIQGYIMKKLCYTSFIILIFILNSFPQTNQENYWSKFTRADTLRGMLTPLRTCYDVTFYDLEIRVDTATQSIKGFNKIYFKVVNDFNKMQVDLFPNMHVDKILLDDGTQLKYTREYGAVFISLPHILKKNSIRYITFYYSGKPQIAKNPPWDGGFTWKKDKEGNPWIVVTCQGTGASLWWPNKDHQSDEPDSMLISITVPPGLEDISNGRLRKKNTLSDGWTKYDWFVSYPINNYDATLNIGKYAHFSNVYTSSDGEKLTLNYYVMSQNLEKAKKQFKDVNRMLKAYEHYFGKYPFYRDGYKLIEAPHNGMEHQSAIAYGNGYIKGYKGYASSEVGLKFDFIIIHESAHEWWGNSITSKDLADMWIHESFAAYAEALFVEYYYGYEESLKYINGKKTHVLNDKPIIGPFNVNHEGSGDMYDKGQLVLNTLRSVINNDSLWFATLKGLYNIFKYQTVNNTEIFNCINKLTGTNYNYFFNQYFRTVNVPTLVCQIQKKGNNEILNYRWSNVDTNFVMPARVTLSNDKFDFIYPTINWQKIVLKNIDPDDFKVDTDRFYVNVKLFKQYIDPESDIPLR
jgi:aminopeptidase N